MNPDQTEEVEALKAIYDEDFRVVSEKEKSLRITLWSDDKSLSLDLLVMYPDDYPISSPPIYEIKNAYWMGVEGQKHIASCLMAIYTESNGGVVLYQWFETVREFLNQKASQVLAASQDTSTDSFEESDSRDEPVSKDTSCPQETVDEDETMSPTVNECKPVCPLILHGDPLTDRKSTFQAHVAQVHTTNQVEVVLTELKTSKKIATASHNILAYRLHDESRDVYHQDYDDDGETAAGGRLLHLLQIMDVRNVVVVVTRWFGGILLHADRFKHINNVARILLQESGIGQKANPSSADSGRVKQVKGQAKVSSKHTKKNKYS